MEEYKHQLYLLCLLVMILGIIVFLNKPEVSLFIMKYFPKQYTDEECSFIPYKSGERICLGKDAGIKTGYYEASTYCSLRGMDLPTREQAWYVWISSENCQRAFAAGGEIPKDKNQFVNSCYKVDNCKTSSLAIQNYCNQTPSIKFPIASQYYRGNFWLKDSPGDKKHYTINYSTGTVNAYPDDLKKFGVRCVLIDPGK